MVPFGQFEGGGETDVDSELSLGGTKWTPIGSECCYCETLGQN